MSGDAVIGGEAQDERAGRGGQGPSGASWYWLAVPLVMVVLMAAGALTGGHWHCY